MKLAVIFLFFFVSFAVAGQAQTSYPKYFAELSFGPSFPIGKFASNSNSSTDRYPAGLAKIGLGLNLSFVYKIKKSIGLMVILGGSKNKQGDAFYKEQQESYYKSFFGTDAEANVVTKSWQIKKILAGGIFEMPFSKNLFLQVKASAGGCKTFIPGYEYTIRNKNSGRLVAGGRHGKIKLPWAFCYQASGALKYQLTSKIYLNTEVSYFNGSAKYEYTDYPNFPSPVPAIPQKKNYPLASVNVLVGIGLQF